MTTKTEDPATVNGIDHKDAEETLHDFRASLIAASRAWESDAETHWNAAENKPLEGHGGPAMAAAYSYVLAAVLRIAKDDYGLEVAHALAAEADEIFRNGDFDDLNADVMPEPEKDAAVEAGQASAGTEVSR